MSADGPVTRTARRADGPPTPPSGPALLRDRSGAQRVSFLELFFDLVYVFAVTQLSHGLLQHLGWATAGQLFLLLLAVWWAWNYTAWFTNFLDPDHPAVRLVLVTIMLASLVMSAALPQAFGERGLVFVVAYLAIQMGRHLFVVISLRGRSLSREFERALVWFCLSAVPWTAGALVAGWARTGLWALALALEYGSVLVGFPVPGLGRGRTDAWTISGEHLVERFRLFLIIALGESILVTGATFGAGAFDTGRTAAFVVAFICAVTLWWIYFGLGIEAADAAVESASDAGLLGMLATYIHVVTVAGVIACAVGDELVIAHPTGHTATTTAVVLTAGPALFLIGNALDRRVMLGRVPRSRVAAVLALALLVPAGRLLPRWRSPRPSPPY